MKFIKSKMLNMFFKYSHDEKDEFLCLDLNKKKNSWNIKTTDLPLLYPSGERRLSAEKYLDILSLLPFVPTNLHQYYKSLPHESVKKKSKSAMLEDVDTLPETLDYDLEEQ